MKHRKVRGSTNSSNSKATLHSEEYFGEQRDYWWNKDFISLMAKRWSLREAQSILDVGCGIGHWGLLLLPELSSSASLVGVDREEIWASKASQKALEKGFAGRTQYIKADVENLPFPDGTFDIVTCQTLLIHVPNVLRALREMVRVLKVRGRICVTEPNNLAWAISDPSIVESTDREVILKRIEFQMICERGKYLLGLGHNSIGESIPRFLKELSLSDISIYTSDKCFSYLPPYSTFEEQANIKQELEWSTRDFWIWSLDETREYFTAGGGAPKDFESYWSIVIKDKSAALQMLKKELYFKPGGGITYLFSGRKSE